MRMRRKSVVATAVLAVVMTMALPALAITDGTVDDGDEFPFVALVADPISGFVCSAAAVDSMHLITAAHCFQDVVNPPNTPVPGVLVFYGYQSFNNPTAVMTGTWIPDDWCPGCGPGLPGFDSKDIAVVKLDAAVELNEYAAIAPEGFTEGLRNKTSVMLVGYGVNDFTPGGGPLANNFEFDGNRRFAPADLIASNHKHADEYLKISSNPSKGKGGACFGDSGGPILYDDGGTWTILANNSYGTNGVCAGVGYANRMDTSDARDFALSIINP